MQPRRFKTSGKGIGYTNHDVNRGPQIDATDCTTQSGRIMHQSREWRYTKVVATSPITSNKLRRKNHKPRCRQITQSHVLHILLNIKYGTHGRWNPRLQAAYNIKKLESRFTSLFLFKVGCDFLWFRGRSKKHYFPLHCHPRRNYSC